jgi:hypothetical protein
LQQITYIMNLELLITLHQNHKKRESE